MTTLDKVWCPRCRRRVEPVDPYGRKKYYEEGVRCGNCGEELDYTEAELFDRECRLQKELNTNMDREEWDETGRF